VKIARIKGVSPKSGTIVSIQLRQPYSLTNKSKSH